MFDLYVTIQFVPHCEHSPCSLSEPVFNVIKGNYRCLVSLSNWALCGLCGQESEFVTVATGGTHTYRRALVC